MILSIQKQDFIEYIVNQINFFFPDNNKILKKDINDVFDLTIDRLSFCFKHIKNKYFFDGTNSLFNHLNSDHYCMFLYFLANNAYMQGQTNLAEKAFYLNKALHGLDLFYKIKMPDIFMLVHPVGTVLGNAQYSNYFIAYQNCTVGSVNDGEYPIFGENTILYSKSSVIGNCKIGNNVVFGANSFIVNTDVPDNKIVLGIYPQVTLKNNSGQYINKEFIK